MTNLDSILKSRDITLLTKVCIVKAMAFPVVMYECESWTIKKAESQRIDAFAWASGRAGDRGCKLSAQDSGLCNSYFLASGVVSSQSSDRCPGPLSWMPKESEVCSEDGERKPCPTWRFFPPAVFLKC